MKYYRFRFDYDEETSVRKYLSNLYERIVNRDIVGKTKSADKKAFMDISLYILANAGKELSIDNIIETYKKRIEKYQDAQYIITWIE